MVRKWRLTTAQYVHPPSQKYGYATIPYKPRPKPGNYLHSIHDCVNSHWFGMIHVFSYSKCNIFRFVGVFLNYNILCLLSIKNTTIFVWILDTVQIKVVVNLSEHI